MIVFCERAGRSRIRARKIRAENCASVREPGKGARLQFQFWEPGAPINLNFLVHVRRLSLSVWEQAALPERFYTHLNPPARSVPLILTKLTNSL